MGAAEERAKVVVWGGGSGGVAAALQAARTGADTLLLTPGGWLGGMVSAAGVCAPDGNELSPWQTGLWGALLRALQLAEAEGLDHNWVSCFGWRPATAERILRGWVAAEPRLRWWPCSTLRGVRRQGRRVTAVEVQRQQQSLQIALDVLIDGSDRGDLLPLAAVPFRCGWEPREQWGEPSAPLQQQLDQDPFFQQQPVQSPTWVVLGQLGQGSCPPGRRPAPPFERSTEAHGLLRTLTYGRLPGGLVMLNWPLHGNDWHDGLGRAFSDDPQQQQALQAEMRAHSSAFAAALSDASDGWLQAAAVFPEAATAAALEGSSALALMPYWREGRRLHGLATVTEGDLLPQTRAAGAGEARLAPLATGPDGVISSVAVGNYPNDHHYPGPDWPLAPKSCRWGGRWSGTPFTIPYGALVCAHLDNLLAADKSFSTSHMANGATRLQPLILNIGQAAGAAAALCVAHAVLPAELPVRALQEALINDPLAPAGPLPLWDTPWHHPEWRQRQHAALAAPERLSLGGELLGAAPPDPGVAPAEPHERLFQGLLQSDGSGGFLLDTAERRWPVITLEPGLHHWLAAIEGPRSVQLIGCANPWGPWLRLSRLAAG